MNTPFIGEIRMFGFGQTPVGWIPCDGTELPSNDYTDLFRVLGATYGGDGSTTFKVPDLRGAAPIHTGAGPKLTPRMLGQMAGRETIKMGPEMPPHSHTLSVTTATATQRTPSTSVVIGALVGDTSFVSPTASGVSPVPWGVRTIGAAGEAEPHPNCMPTLTLNFCIAGVGMRPDQA